MSTPWYEREDIFQVRIAREILVEKLSRVASCSTSAAAFDARPRVLARLGLAPADLNDLCGLATFAQPAV